MPKKNPLETVVLNWKTKHGPLSGKNRSAWVLQNNSNIRFILLLFCIGHANPFLPDEGLLHFFDPKQLLWVFCIWWCYFKKWPSILLWSTCLWCLSVAEIIIEFYFAIVWFETDILWKLKLTRHNNINFKFYKTSFFLFKK